MIANAEDKIDNEEKYLIKQLEASGKLGNHLPYEKFRTGVRVESAKALTIRGLGKFSHPKIIDAMFVRWKEPKSFYIIEAKRELDYKAIGQVLAYGILWKKRKRAMPIANAQMAIVCRRHDSELLYVCNMLNISVYEVRDKGDVVKLEPEPIGYLF
jgi:hypothetical protein